MIWRKIKTLYSHVTSINSYQTPINPTPHLKNMCMWTRYGKEWWVPKAEPSLALLRGMMMSEGYVSSSDDSGIDERVSESQPTFLKKRMASVRNMRINDSRAKTGGWRRWKIFPNHFCLFYLRSLFNRIDIPISNTTDWISKADEFPPISNLNCQLALNLLLILDFDFDIRGKMFRA